MANPYIRSIDLTTGELVIKADAAQFSFPIQPPVPGSPPVPVVTKPPLVKPPPVTTAPPVTIAPPGAFVLPQVAVLPDTAPPRSAVRFAGTSANDGGYSNQAYCRAVPSPTEADGPFFMCGLICSVDFMGEFLVCSFGNTAPLNGMMAVTLEYASTISLYMWGAGPDQPRTQDPWVTLCRNTAKPVLGKWSHFTLVVESTTRRWIVLDDVLGMDVAEDSGGAIAGAALPIKTVWPFVNAWGPELRLSLGSYFSGGPDAHNFNGYFSDWIVGKGIPTMDEIKRHRQGISGQAIWGSRVWAAWPFTNDPSTGTEKDVSGNGHDLTYMDAGTLPGHSLPVVVTA